MRAPEKIYIHPDIGGKEFLRPWLHSPADNDSVEYTRTDAFIEKACEFISKHIESDKYVSHDEELYRIGCPYNYFETNIFIADFKKYMKGK